MEKIEISEEQEQKLLSHFKSRAGLWIVFMIIGLSGLIPIGITAFSGDGVNYLFSPTFVFFIIGIALWGQSSEALKKIKNSDYQVYKAECKKVGVLGSASVENNEILSKKVNKPIKGIEIIGSAKSIKVGDEIGILQTGKEFWAFSLTE